MGYRCYIHPVNGTEPDTGEDACIGKLIGYVSDDHINDLSVLPFIAFGLQYGQHEGDTDVTTLDDVRIDMDRWQFNTLGSYMDVMEGQRILLPWWMLFPFLIAYYNDQQTFYIEHNKQPLLDYNKLSEAVQTILWHYSDLRKHMPSWKDSQYYVIYWC